MKCSDVDVALMPFLGAPVRANGYLRADCGRQRYRAAGSRDDSVGNSIYALGGRHVLSGATGVPAGSRRIWKSEGQLPSAGRLAPWPVGPRLRCDCAVTPAVRSGPLEHPGIPTTLKTQPLRRNW